MSRVRRLLDELAANGGRAFIEGDRVRIAISGAPPEDLLARLREAREEIRRELAPISIYDHERLQREADRRNREAERNHLTDRFCACGNLATFAWRQGNREIWKCLECGPTGGTA